MTPPHPHPPPTPASALGCKNSRGQGAVLAPGDTMWWPGWSPCQSPGRREALIPQPPSPISTARPIHPQGGQTPTSRTGPQGQPCDADTAPYRWHGTPHTSCSPVPTRPIPGLCRNATGLTASMPIPLTQRGAAGSTQPTPVGLTADAGPRIAHAPHARHLPAGTLPRMPASPPHGWQGKDRQTTPAPCWCCLRCLLPTREGCRTFREMEGVPGCCCVVS